MDFTLEARQVEVDDYLYNSLATHHAFQWVRVVKVERSPECVVIHTTVWQTHKYPREAVAVRRFDRDNI